MASTSRSSDNASICEESSDVTDIRDSDDETDGHDADISECSAMSHFMARFKQPEPSHLARKRRIQCNPPVGMKRSKGRTANYPKNVSAADRVKQFPNELTLYCVLRKAFLLSLSGGVVY